MTNLDRAVRVLHESLDRIWGYDAPDWADDIAADLRDAGLLAPEPQIIRTREELDALDPDTVLMGDEAILLTAADCVENSGFPLYDADRLAVVAAGDQARAARQALKEV